MTRPHHSGRATGALQNLPELVRRLHTATQGES
jgi:hypothetical protein